MKKSVKTIILALLFIAVVATSLIAFVGCDDNIAVGYLPAETIRYDLDISGFQLTMLGDQVNNIVKNMGELIDAVFVKEETYFELTSDGVFTMQLMVKLQDVLRLLSTLKVLESTDIGGMEGVDALTKSSLAPTITGYVDVFFPGFEYDIDNVLERLGAVGLSIIGVDETNAEWAKFVEYIENPENDRLIPESFDLANLPETIGVRLRAPYRLLDSFDKDGNKQFTMATLGPHDEDTLPFANFFLTSRDTTYYHYDELTFTNEMLGLTLKGSIETPLFDEEE